MNTRPATSIENHSPTYLGPTRHGMRLFYESQHYTGGGLAFGLRNDIYQDILLGMACEYNAVIGCLDARETLPGGTIKVANYPDARLRIVGSAYVPRGATAAAA